MKSETLFKIKLNPELCDLFLELKSNFTQPYLIDFLKMKSAYSMAVWHVMQMKMKSKLPGIKKEITFQISVEELRIVTGCQKKYKQIGQFKQNVLDKAIREIRENCLVEIAYRNKKNGREIIGFIFIAKSFFGC